MPELSTGLELTEEVKSPINVEVASELEMYVAGVLLRKIDKLDILNHFEVCVFSHIDVNVAVNQVREKLKVMHPEYDAVEIKYQKLDHNMLQQFMLHKGLVKVVGS